METEITIQSAEHADRILTHYITQAMRKAGLRVDGDTYSELSTLIQDVASEIVRLVLAQSAQPPTQE